MASGRYDVLGNDVPPICIAPATTRSHRNNLVAVDNDYNADCSVRGCR